MRLLLFHNNNHHNFKEYSLAQAVFIINNPYSFLLYRYDEHILYTTDLYKYLCV
jgi:hypothetical protein